MTEYKLSKSFEQDLEILGDPNSDQIIAAGGLLVVAIRREIQNAYKQGIIDGISSQKHTDTVAVGDVQIDNDTNYDIGGKE